MRLPRSLLLLPLLGLASCIFGVQSSNGGPGSNGPPPDGAVDGRADGSGDAGEECKIADDCRKNLPHARASCRDFRCRYTCQGEWQNRDGDLSNGCELCTNRNVWYADCDGDEFAPGGAQTQDVCGDDKPSLPPDSCSGKQTGSWTNRKPTGDGLDCNDRTKLAAPSFGRGNATFQENWLCDTLNNDCDDQTDEACCTDPASIDPATVGTGNVEQSHPAFTTAPTGAPNAAEFAVAWAQNKRDDKVVVTYLDARGDAAPFGRTTFTPKENDPDVKASAIRGLDIATANGSVVVAYIWETSNNEYRLDVRLYNASQNLSSNPTNLATSGQQLKFISIGSASNKFLVSYIRKTAAPVKFQIRAVGFQTDNNTIRASNVIRLTSGPNGPVNGGPAKTSTQPVTQGNQDSIAVAWWNIKPLFDSDGMRNNTEKPHIFGTQIPTSSIAANLHAPPSGRFSIKTRDTRQSTKTISMAWTGKDELTFIYPGTAGVRRRLRRTKLNLDDGSTSHESLTSKRADDRSPTAVFVPRDQIGVEDESKTPFAVIWLRRKPGQRNRRSLMSGGFDMVQGATTPLAVAGPADGLRQPRLAPGRSSLSLGALWLDTGGTDTLQFYPVSRQGVPVCQ